MTIGPKSVVDVELKHVNTTTKRLASGKIRTYFYFRPTGERLPGEPGSAEFLAGYIKASEANKAAENVGTLKSIIEDYQRSSKYRYLADRTRRDYQKQLVKIEGEFGKCPIPVLNDCRIRGDFLRWRDELGRTSLKQADYAITVLGMILHHGMDMGLIANNYAARPGKLYKPNRQDKIWLEDSIAAFMDKAPYEFRLAMILALHTGQRQGDLRRAAWSNWDGHRIVIAQSKTGARVEIPATAALKAALDAAPRRAATILSTETGKTWGEDHFRHKWREITLRAKVDGLRFQDLRGTSITMLSEAGASIPEIAAITGHKLQSVSTILETYLSRTRHLSDSAIVKFQNSKNTAFANQLQTGRQKGQ